MLSHKGHKILSNFKKYATVSVNLKYDELILYRSLMNGEQKTLLCFQMTSPVTPNLP